VTVPPYLSDHMVLQRDLRVPIWGIAAPGELVTVKFRDQETTATTDAAGKWRVHLQNLNAGGPDELTIVGTNTIAIRDVLVGEVWFGGGQSNMLGAKQVPAGHPDVRYAQGGTWTAGDAVKTRIAAIAFNFGLLLHQELKVPVGLYVNAIGGASVDRLLRTHADFAPFAVRGVATFTGRWELGKSVQNRPGETAILTWSAEGANRVRLGQSGAALETRGTRTVSPKESTLYELIAEGPSGPAILHWTGGTAHQGRLQRLAESPDGGAIPVPVQGKRPRTGRPPGIGRHVRAVRRSRGRRGRSRSGHVSAASGLLQEVRRRGGWFQRAVAWPRNAGLHRDSVRTIPR
jgi:hypothetical protein